MPKLEQRLGRAISLLLSVCMYLFPFPLPPFFTFYSFFLKKILFSQYALTNKEPKEHSQPPPSPVSAPSPTLPSGPVSGTTRWNHPARKPSAIANSNTFAIFWGFLTYIPPNALLPQKYHRLPSHHNFLLNQQEC